MIHNHYWDRLSETDKAEVTQLSEKFQRAVDSLETPDGINFSQAFDVYQNNGLFFVAKSWADPALGDIRSKRWAVINYLFTAATQQ